LLAAYAVLRTLRDVFILLKARFAKHTLTMLKPTTHNQQLAKRVTGDPARFGPPEEHALFKENYFTNEQGLWIFTRRWEPKGQPKGLILLIHGMGEHCSRYEMVAETLTNAGFAVHALDHQGHGRSEGDRCHVEKFQHYVDDALAMGRNAAKCYRPSLPVFILGHSMGGCIAVHTAQQAHKSKELNLRAVVLSAPALGVDPKVAPPALVVVGRVLSQLLPKLPLDPLPGDFVSSDPAVVQQYLNDPLVYHGGVRARMGIELIDAINNAKDLAPQIQWPFLIMHGTEDKLVPFSASEEFFAKCTSCPDKQNVWINGAFHEIFNEPSGRTHAQSAADFFTNHTA